MPLMTSKAANNAATYLFGKMRPQLQDEFLQDFAQPSGVEGYDDVVPMNVGAALGEQGGVGLRQMASLLTGAARSHPIATMGLGALGAGNVGGLIDNDKFGGQLGGLALGGLGAYLGHMHPGMAAAMTLGGGELGALFDKLRAKKEQPRGQMPQQAPRR